MRGAATRTPTAIAVKAKVESIFSKIPKAMAGLKAVSSSSRNNNMAARMQGASAGTTMTAIQDTKADTQAPQQFRTLFISDIHLGTRGCQAELLLDFLKHNNPRSFSSSATSSTAGG